MNHFWGYHMLSRCFGHSHISESSWGKSHAMLRTSPHRIPIWNHWHFPTMVNYPRYSHGLPPHPISRWDFPLWKILWIPQFRKPQYIYIYIYTYYNIYIYIYIYLVYHFGVPPWQWKPHETPWNPICPAPRPSIAAAARARRGRASVDRPSLQRWTCSNSKWWISTRFKHENPRTMGIQWWIDVENHGNPWASNKQRGFNMMWTVNK